MLLGYLRYGIESRIVRCAKYNDANDLSVMLCDSRGHRVAEDTADLHRPERKVRKRKVYVTVTWSAVFLELIFVTT